MLSALIGTEPLYPAIPALAAAIGAGFPVNRVLLYGSRARGDHLPRADVDLAVDAPDLTDRQWYDILDLVEAAPTLLKIDCVLLQKAKGSFLQEILKDGTPLYERSKG